MKKLWFKTLLRSLMKTAVTFLLLLASAFLLTRNLTDYLSSRSAYQEALKNYEGVLTVEHPYLGKAKMSTPLFLLTEPGMPENRWHPQEQLHVQSLDAETVEALSALPYVERTETRYMTAGVSDYERVYNPRKLYAYTLRFVVEGTLASCEAVEETDELLVESFNERLNYHLRLSDAELLAGDSDVYSLCVNADNLLQVYVGISLDADRPYMPFVGSGGGLERYGVFCMNYPLHEELDFQEGHRYVFVLRGDWLTFNQGAADLFAGDDSINGWWPYITDVTDEPDNYLETEAYAPLRQLIQVTEDDRHTLDVVYCDDMNSLRRVTTDRMFLRDGRFLTPDDAGKPVCVLSENQAAACGLSVGDTLTLELGNHLCEQYVGLGALAVSQARYSTEFTPQDFTVVGIYADTNQRDASKEHLVNSTKWLDKDLYWGYSDATVFVPASFLPESVDLKNHEFKPGEVSFVIDPENIRAFQEECLPLVESMGLDFDFSDGGWLAVGEPLKQTELLSMVKLLIFSLATLLASVLTVFLFIGHRKREFAVLRALGTEPKAAAGSLRRPFLLLAAIAVLPGSIAAAVSEKMNSGQWQIIGVLLSIAALLFVLWGMAALNLRHLGKRPVLELMQLSAPVKVQRRREETETETAVAASGEVLNTGLDGLTRKKHNGLTRRYIRRHILRSTWKSLLAILLAALLAFGMTELTALRAKNRELVDTVETKAFVTGGLSYDRAIQVLDSGMVKAHYFEQVKDCEMNERKAVCCLVSDFRRLNTGEITWLDGWDSESFFSREKICVLSRPYMEAQGLNIGDRVLLNEPDCMGTMLTNHEDWSLEDFYEWRAQHRPECTIVGVWETESVEDTIYAPMDAEYYYRFEWSYTSLDVAEYTLNRYGEAEAFTGWMNDLLARVAQPVRLMIDTAEAERAERMSRLTELIYPAAFLLSLLLGTVLPGLIILQNAKEASILRALGTTKKRTRAMLTLEQALLCAIGLLLSGAAVITLHRPELPKLLLPLGSYCGGHLAACIVGCLLFAVSVTKKRVLDLLQVKE